MGLAGCNINGNLDDAKFSEPMPWIGIYVAAASLACSIAMGVDAIRGFTYKKCWFPCKFFSLNATSLTLIAVAIKLSVDLNTVMPRCQDQLVKLSSSVLICTIMGNSMPSLGPMESEEIAMTIVAMAILVITLVVNICIQLGTGVIYVFWKEHVFVMFLMLVLLVLLIFTALTVPSTKRYLEHKYDKKYHIAVKEGMNENCRIPINKLREDLTRFWMMAHTCCPQFVIGRSVTCTASGVFCLLGALTLGEAMIRSYFMPWSFRFCSGESDYKWSATLILATQAVGVGVGTIAPAFRWFFGINFRCPKRGRECWKREFTVERYWIQGLVEMKESPLAFSYIKNRHCRKLAHEARIGFMDACIRTQTGIVLASKAIRFISIFFVSRILLCSDFCKGVKKKLKSINSISSNETESESQPEPKFDLGHFVLHLEGEDVLVDLMKRNNRDATDHWIRMGKKKELKHLVKLLEESSFSPGFKEFDSSRVPSLEHEEPPNCWALPIVTVTAIALALPNIKQSSLKQLICGVNEGLQYVRLVEDNISAKDLTDIRKAANVVWLGIELFHKWLDVDIFKLAIQTETPAEILEELSLAAKNKFEEFKTKDTNHCLKENPSKWPIKALAANSMYRISKTILQNHAHRNNQTSERLFEELSAMLSDILCACLTNLQRVISVKCLSSRFEDREKSVRHAGFLLGQAENVLKIVDRKSLPSLDPNQMACIDKWRILLNQQNQLSPSESGAARPRPSDLYLTVE